jgi:hypothetical protein
MFFSMNVKTFGLVYYEDSTITNISFVGSSVMFLAKMTSGIFLDKYGLIFCFRASLSMSIVAIF